MKCPHCEKIIAKKDVIPEFKIHKNTFKRKLRKASETWNKNVNILISKKKTKVHEDLFFGKEKNHDDGSITVHYKEDVWLTTVMRDIGVFKSTSEAKGSGWHRKANIGFTDEVLIIKGKPHRVCIIKDDSVICKK